MGMFNFENKYGMELLGIKNFRAQLFKTNNVVI